MDAGAAADALRASCRLYARAVLLYGCKYLWRHQQGLNQVSAPPADVYACRVLRGASSAFSCSLVSN